MPNRPYVTASQMFGGRSAEEVHWEAVGLRCDRCGGPPVVEVMLFAPALELVREHPRRAMAIAAAHGGSLPVVMLKGPGREPLRFVRALRAAACRHHDKELQVMAARAPSTWFADVRRGPGPDRALVAT